jgi:hypothetical protein
MLYSKAMYEEELDTLNVLDAEITRGVAEGTLGGFVALRQWAKVEEVRKSMKGKLLGTRMILMDGDKKSKCADIESHNVGCRCKALTMQRLAEAERVAE